MRRLATLCAALSVCLPSRALADRAGPDRGGYEWIDSGETGVTYEWIDIAGTGTEVTLGDDGETAPIPLGFDLEYYGIVYASARIGANGYMTFISNSQTGLPWHCPLPDVDEPNGAVFGFYQDLDPSEDAGGGIYYETLDPGTGSASFVVMFDSIDLFQGSPAFGSDPVTFEIVLYEDTGEIQVNVLESGDLGGGPRWSMNTVVGIENDDGTIGIGQCTGTIADLYSVRFVHSTGYGLFPPAQTLFGVPGETVTFEMELVNFSGAEITADVTALPRMGWTAAPVATPVTAAAGGGVGMVRIAVDVPATAALGHRDIVDVDVTVSGIGTVLEAELELWATLPDEDWQLTHDLPTALQDVQVVSDGEFLYSMGGSYLDTSTDMWTPTGDTWRWSPENNYWWDAGMADLPVPLTAGSACYMDGRIYYVGGWDGAASDMEHWSFSPDIYIYEIATDTWTTGEAPTHTMALANIACQSASNSVYVFNGYADLDGNGDFINRADGGLDWTEPHTLVYLVDSDGWVEREASSDGVSGSGTGLIGNTILLAGGFFDDETDPASSGWVTRATRIYNTVSDSWTSGEWLSTFRSRTAGVVYDDQLCVLGGRISGDPVDSWECYADGAAWVMQPSVLTLARESAGAAVLGAHIYVVAGDAGGWVTDRSERWPTASLPTPTPPETEPDAVTDDDVEPVPDAAGDPDAEMDAEEEGQGGGGKGCGCTIAC